MIIFQNGIRFTEHNHNLEKDFEGLIIDNSKLFFGKDSIYIDAKRKIDAKSLGGTIPDGFLFDLSDKDNPEFYLVEVELSKSNFFNHVFPQITKFFAFYKNSKSQSELVEKIFAVINHDPGLKKDFKKYLGEKEVYKFIKDTVENSQNILLIIDNEMKEIPEITETYSDTWGKMVKLMILKTFVNGNDVIYIQNPEFENIEFADLKSVDEKESEESEYTEEYHLENVSENVKQIYKKMKEDILNNNKDLFFNPQKYYISIVDKKNIAFFMFRKKKLRLVVMLNETEVKQRIKAHLIKHLSAGVQKFWNGPSTEIIIDSPENIEEILNIITALVKKD